MINVLITGSRGFLGVTLRKKLLTDSTVRVLEYCRADSDDLLHEYVKIADFIFHFAGEVKANWPDPAERRPSSDGGGQRKRTKCNHVAGRLIPPFGQQSRCCWLDVPG